MPKRLLALAGDDALVEQIRRGNHAAFEVAFERHSPGILSFCRHMLGSLEAGEDAVQQTFAAAHGDILRSDKEIRLKPWLYTIARNRCLSMLRARREQPVEEVPVDSTGLQEEVQHRADLRELLADLADLPAQQRAALVLSEIGDLNHAEVAEALGVQTKNVKSLVFRARSGLIERRDARDLPCGEIRERLANLRGGALRSGDLRHHLKACPGCSDYLAEVRRQKAMMAVVLPVIPTLGLKRGVLSAVGASSAAGGGAAVGGGTVAAGVAKVAAAVAIAGGAGAAGVPALEDALTDADPPAAVPPRAQPKADPPVIPSPRAVERRSERSRGNPAAPDSHGKDRSGRKPKAGRGRRAHGAPSARQTPPRATPARPPQRGRASPPAPSSSATPPRRPTAPQRGGTVRERLLPPPVRTTQPRGGGLLKR